MKKFLLPFFILIFVFGFNIKDVQAKWYSSYGGIYDSELACLTGGLSDDPYYTCTEGIVAPSDPRPKGVFGVLRDFAKGIVSRFKAGPTTTPFVTTKEKTMPVTAPIQQAPARQIVAEDVKLSWIAAEGAQYHYVTVFDSNGNIVIPEQKITGFTQFTVPAESLVPGQIYYYEVVGAKQSVVTPGKELRGSAFRQSFTAATRRVQVEQSGQGFFPNLWEGVLRAFRIRGPIVIPVPLSTCQPNTWVQKKDFGGGVRAGAVAFAIGNKGYAGLGYNSATNLYDDFWEYTPGPGSQLGVWTQKADFSGGARHGAVGFSIGSKGYVGTGQSIKSSGSGWQNVKNDFWEYNPTTNTWTQKANFGGAARVHAVGFGAGNSGYIGTGINSSASATGLSDFWEYNPGSNTWIQRANFGGGGTLGGFGFAIYDAYGGYTVYMGGAKDNSNTTEFWQYYVGNDIWVQNADIPGLLSGAKREFFTGFSIAGKGYIGTGLSAGSFSKDFWEYDPASDLWSQIQSIPSPGEGRMYAFGFSVGNKGYIGTGTGFGSGSYLQDVWSYCAGVDLNVTKSGSGNGTVKDTPLSKINCGMDCTEEYGLETTPVTVTLEATPASGSSFAGWSSNCAPIAGTNKCTVQMDSDKTVDAIFIYGSINLNVTKSGSGSGAVKDSPQSKINCGTDCTEAYSSFTTVTLEAIEDVGSTFAGWSSNCAPIAGTNKCTVQMNQTKTVNAIFALCNDNWTQKADLPVGKQRNLATGFSIGNKGYMGTGGDISSGGTGTPLKDFWEWNQSTNTWTQKADFGGSARWGAVGFSIGGKGYIGTGGESASVVKNDFWEYNPTTNTWTQKANFGGLARYTAVGFSIGNKGYVGTGLVPSGTGSGFKNDFWEYNPTTNTWTQKANFGGSARQSATGLSIGNKGYIGLGWDSSSKNDFWEYDPTVNSWTQKQSYAGSFTHGSPVAFSIGSKGYVGTGLAGGALKNFFEYDSASTSNGYDVNGNPKGKWTQKANLDGAARWSATGFSIGSKGYIVTGKDNNSAPLRDLWEYCPSI